MSITDEVSHKLEDIDEEFENSNSDENELKKTKKIKSGKKIIVKQSKSRRISKFNHHKKKKSQKHSVIVMEE